MSTHSITLNAEIAEMRKTHLKRQDQPGTYHLNYQFLDQFIAISIAHSLISASSPVWQFLCIHSTCRSSPLWSPLLCSTFHIQPLYTLSIPVFIHWFDNRVFFLSLYSRRPLLGFPFQCHLFRSFPFQFVWQSACAVNLCIWLSHYVPVIQSIFVLSNRSCI